MKRVIIISTFKDSLFLKDCLESLIGCKYPVIIHFNSEEKNEFEMGAVRIGKELEIDEFFVLPDTCKIKNLEIFDIAFDIPQSCCLDLNYLSYVGKYRLEVLNQLELPIVRTKIEAWQQEFEFHEKYARIEKPVKLFPGFWDDKNSFQFFHNDRLNLVNENEYIIKYKGCYTKEMVLNYE